MPPKTISTRFRLTLEYDGTRFSGWQKQDDAKTIQGTLLFVAAEIFGRPDADIQGNGRTDAGVHALRYIAHLDVVTELTPEAIRMRFNDLLPQDIVVLAVERTLPRFHARHNCIGRSYLYRISTRKTALERKFVWWVKDRLDCSAMGKACQLFTGMHDFVSFAEKQELKKSTKVLVNAVSMHQGMDLITFRVIGSHFLWKMVRRMVGVLVEKGRHTLTEADIQDFLTIPSSRPARFTAPSSGLFFERAFYEDEEFKDFLANNGQSPPACFRFVP